MFCDSDDSMLNEHMQNKQMLTAGVYPAVIIPINKTKTTASSNHIRKA